MLGWHQVKERVAAHIWIPVPSSPSVCEKGTDLVVQELATCPLTQDLLQEDVRKAWPSTRPIPTSWPQSLPTRLTLFPRLAISWTRVASKSTCGRDESPAPRRRRLPSAGLW